LRCFTFSHSRERLPGVYRDELRRVDGDWLFSLRHVDVDPRPTD